MSRNKDKTLLFSANIQESYVHIFLAKGLCLAATPLQYIVSILVLLD